MKGARPQVPVALVTGASRGIGAATALELARAGHDLVLTATRKAGARAVADEARALGRRVHEAVFDGAKKADADRLVREALDAFSRVDVLVNNAGVVVRRDVVRMVDEDFDKVLAVNLHAPFWLIRRLLPQMLRHGWGRIVNVSSISATLGTPGLSGYCASKWGLDGLTKALAEELRGTGVFVASVLPGSVDTDMLKGSGFRPAMSAAEVARVVRYLASEAPPAMLGSRVEMFG